MAFSRSTATSSSPVGANAIADGRLICPGSGPVAIWVLPGAPATVVRFPVASSILRMASPY
jgi:hypothetical protein